MEDGFHSQRQAVKRWRRRNPEKVRAYHKAWRERNKDKLDKYQLSYQQKWIDEHPEKHLWTKVRDRAKQSGMEFTINVTDIVIPESCPLLGILMFFDPGGGYNPNAPSLDRIDNDKGYVPGNIWVISSRANTMKNKASIEELKTFATNVLIHF
jgi:hypothetical protein